MACRQAASSRGSASSTLSRGRASVSNYESPFEFTGKLIKVTVTMDNDQMLDGDGVGRAQMGRE
jgi:arylsulfatase